MSSCWPTPGRGCRAARAVTPGGKSGMFCNLRGRLWRDWLRVAKLHWSEDGVKLPDTAFVAVLRREAQDSLAMFTMILGQPAISSQLIDNLNASIHLRALLTDMFLVGEILRSRSHVAVMSGKE